MRWKDTQMFFPFSMYSIDGGGPEGISLSLPYDTQCGLGASEEARPES